ncbi:hypothetical protein KY285_016323 [Solanum tuberosum]|nr:hypothetical protein KY284_016316 [Solanum tuberosum]KAH0702045.1 hypothetical protein KY285_016323 [Solanum tuberosum]
MEAAHKYTESNNKSTIPAAKSTCAFVMAAALVVLCLHGMTPRRAQGRLDQSEPSALLPSSKFYGIWVKSRTNNSLVWTLEARFLNLG